MKAALGDKDNIEFLKVTGKNHNPNYTENAVKLSGEMFKAYSDKLKTDYFDSEENRTAFRESYNWHKLTEQDMEIWDRIYDHLEK